MARIENDGKNGKGWPGWKMMVKMEKDGQLDNNGQDAKGWPG